MATVAQLGARALRKLGIALVGNAERPAAAPALTAAAVAARVLRELGIPVPEADRPAPIGVLTDTDVAVRVLRDLGVNPLADAIAPVALIDVPEIARRSLRSLGVNPGDFGSAPSSLFFTYQQIATEAIRRAAIDAPDVTPEAASQTYAEDRVLAVHDRLVALDLAYWPLLAIPAAVAEPMIVMTANLIAPAFGKPSGDVGAAATEAIRQQVLSGPLAQTRTENRVMSAHYELTAQGLADWDLSHIPDAVSDAYVTLVSSRIAPAYGQKPDPQAEEMARAQVRKYALSGPRGLAIAQQQVWQVHDDLNARGLVAWPVTAIPYAHVDDYVVMSAGKLAPVYGGQSDQDGYDRGVERMRVKAKITSAQQRAQDRVLAVHEELNAMSIVTWDVNAIPASMADAYAGLAKVQMGEEGGTAGNPAEQESYYRRIRQIAMGGPAGQALAEQKVRAVHASLDARGKIRWTIHNIPVPAEEPLVFMAAALLAPECGVQADPSWLPGAEMALARIVSLPSQNMPVQVDYF